MKRFDMDEMNRLAAQAEAIVRYEVKREYRIKMDVLYDRIEQLERENKRLTDALIRILPLAMRIVKNDLDA